MSNTDNEESSVDDIYYTLGRFGVGTDEPGAGLEIDKGKTNDLALLLNSSGSSWGSGVQFKNTAQGGKTYGIYSGSGHLHVVEVDTSNKEIDRFVIDGSGNVGIGTTTPAGRLTLEGIVQPGQGRLTFFSNSADVEYDGGSDGIFLFKNTAPNGKTAFVGGDVGIGTSSPSQRFHVAGGNGVVNNVFLGDVGHGQDWAGFSHASTTSPTAYGFLQHSSGQYALINKRSGAGWIGFRVDNQDKMTITDTGDVQLNGKHAFRTTDPWLRLNQDGAFTAGVHTPGMFAPGSLNVGGSRGWEFNPGNGCAVLAGTIGTNGLPAAPKKPGWGGGIRTWDVEAEGTIWSAHGIDTSPHDLAENYFSDLELKAGDVVCLDPKDDRIVQSERANDNLVLGVISTQPGFLLNAEHGEEEERKDGKRAYPVALSGRVPCHVTDENGPITRGDLLTSSSTRGHAMKATPHIVGGVELYAPGTIIGKALESLATGLGVIEVFVTLR